MVKKIVLAAFAALTFTAPGAAQISRQGDGYLFRMKWTKGQTMRYNMVTSMSPASGSKNAPPAMNMPMTYRVLDVRGNSATIEMTLGPMSGMQGAKAEKVTVRMDNRGRMSGVDERVRQMAMTSSLEFPERAIRPGFTWNSTQKVQGVDVKSTYRFVRITSVGGREVAELTFDMSGSGPGGMSISGNGTLLLRTEDGSLQRMSSSPTMRMAGSGGGQPMTVRTTVTITRS